MQRLARADVTAARRVRAFVDARVDVTRAAAVIGEVTGARVSARLRSAGAADARVLDPGALGVLLADATAPERSVLVEVEAALAVALVSGALKRPRTRVVDASRAVTPELAGATGALFVACARKLAQDAPLRVLSCGSAAALWAEAHRHEPDRVAATFLVLVDDDAYVARASIPRALSAPAPPFDAAALGTLPLALPLVAASSVAGRGEVEALRPGDAWLPRAATLARTAAGLSGHVALCGPANDLGVRADVRGDEIVLTDEAVPLPWEVPMDGKAALSESLGDVPVVVRVEVGTAQLAAREWARLGAGDVVTLGRRVGEHVLLRVGGEEVARGELVDVEGELGVRIVARS